MRILTQISSIIVALLFVYAINFKSFLTFDYFINQSEVIELFCINKDKPEMACNGKCHLATQLEKVEEDNDLPFTPTSINYSLEINPLLNSSAAIEPSGAIEIAIQQPIYLSSELNDGYLTNHSPPPEA